MNSRQKLLSLFKDPEHIEHYCEHTGFSRHPNKRTKLLSSLFAWLPLISGQIIIEDRWLKMYNAAAHDKRIVRRLLCNCACYQPILLSTIINIGIDISCVCVWALAQRFSLHYFIFVTLLALWEQRIENAPIWNNMFCPTKEEKKEPTRTDFLT